jgi:hypothetical protein
MLAALSFSSVKNNVTYNMLAFVGGLGATFHTFLSLSKKAPVLALITKSTKIHVPEASLTLPND